MKVADQARRSRRRSQGTRRADTAPTPSPASILLRRGLSEPEDILFFLEDDPRYLHNPFRFAQMEDAVDRILLAADEGEKVLVFGDRDTDGVTGTVLMVEALAELGHRGGLASSPLGREPYGLSIAAVEAFAAESGTLIVTVDCGISNVAEVERAAELMGRRHRRRSPHASTSGDPPPAVAVHRPQAARLGLSLPGPRRLRRGLQARVRAQAGPLGRLQAAGRPPQRPAPSTTPTLVEAVRLSNLVERLITAGRCALLVRCENAPGTSLPKCRQERPPKCAGYVAALTTPAIHGTTILVRNERRGSPRILAPDAGTGRLHFSEYSP